MVVAEFLVQAETAVRIEEALAYLQTAAPTGNQNSLCVNTLKLRSWQWNRLFHQQQSVFVISTLS